MAEARLTARRLNRATLERQLLLRREPLPVVDGVHRVVALQAQEPASPYIALWNRIADFDPSELDAAFTERALVKATLMRITLHAVDIADHPVFHEAMQTTLRAARLNDQRFTSTGLSVADAEAIVPDLLEFASAPRTNADVERWLGARLGERPERGVWWAIRTFAPLVHAPTAAPWTFGPRPSYVAAPTAPRPARDEAVRHLVRRYLEGFGPASPSDVAQFALLRQPTVRPALESLSDELSTFEGPDGGELFDVSGAPLPADDTPAPPRLLAMWDSVLLAYADRGRVIPPEYRPLVLRRNGDVLPTVLVDGFVCGVWRPVDGGIEASAFHQLPDDAWKGLADEARGLVALIRGRDAATYRRYGRWWAALPAADVRVLPG